MECGRWSWSVPWAWPTTTTRPSRTAAYTTSASPCTMTTSRRAGTTFRSSRPWASHESRYSGGQAALDGVTGGGRQAGAAGCLLDELRSITAVRKRTTVPLAAEALHHGHEFVDRRFALAGADRGAHATLVWFASSCSASASSADWIAESASARRRSSGPPRPFSPRARLSLYPVQTL